MENNQEKNEQFKDCEQYQSLAKKFLKKLMENPEKADDFFNDLASFQKEHPEVKNFELWQNLMGSTPPAGLDFDSPDRIVRNFMDEIAEKYISE